MMKLHKNWKQILSKAWSLRLMLLAGLLSGLEVVLPMFRGDMSRGVFAALTVLVICGAMVARVVAQRNLADDE